MLELCGYIICVQALVLQRNLLKRRMNVLFLQLIPPQYPKFIIFKIYPVLKLIKLKMNYYFSDICKFGWNFGFNTSQKIQISTR